MKFNKNQFMALFAAFLLGALVTFYSTNYFKGDALAYARNVPQKVFQEKSDKVTNIQSSRGDAQTQMEQIRQQMRQQMNQMMGSAFSAPSFDRSGVEVTNEEDKDYKYIKISGEGVDKDSLDIKIKRGMISISGELRRVSGDGQGNESSYISQFSQSFNTPSNIIEDDVKIESQDGAVVLKFKKASL